MGGKAQRRREKNFLAAHGGNTRLPPPPKPSDLDALPSKLRKLMGFMSPSTAASAATKLPNLQGHARVSKDAKNGKRKGNTVGDQNEYSSTAAEFKEESNHENVKILENKDHRDKLMNANTDDKKKRKRKRKEADDLRFQSIDQDLAVTGLSKRERRKKYLEARKKKHKKATTDERQDFSMREEIRFGEVVKAPPKIIQFPKATKIALGASHERLRLQAIGDYRKRKGWVSRPGIHLPSITTTLSS